MTDPYQEYQSLSYTLPEKTILWNMYGAGLENIGLNGKHEIRPNPEPADNK